MKRKITLVVVILLICVGGFFGYRSVTRRNALRAAARNAGGIAQAVVERRDLEVAITGNGTIQTSQKKTVQSGVAGKITGVFVDEGDTVKAGDPIINLSNESASYQADQARLDLALAQQSLDTLQSPAGGKAKAELDVRSAETSLTKAEDQVAALAIKAPIAGEVWDLAVKTGDDVKSGQVIATIGDTSVFTVKVQIKQAELTRFWTGAAVVIIPGGDLPLMTGILTSIGKEGSSGSGSIVFPGVVTISKPDPNLRAGMTVSVNHTDNDGNVYSLTGTVNAQDRIEAKAEVDGTVTSVGVSEGDEVAKGAVLVAMENNSLTIARDQAANALESYRQTLASFQSNIDSQVLKVESARIAYEQKLEALSKLTVRSPVDGKVLSCSVQVGDEISATQDLVSIGKMSPLIVSIPVDELDVVNVEPGQPVTVEVDAIPGEVFTGAVQKIAQEGTVQQGVTNYSVTVEIWSDAPRLGMSATATISTAQKSQVLTVPIEAITWEQGQAYVTQMESGQTAKKKIKVGVQGDLYAEIVSGLEEGDSIVIGSGSNSGGNGLNFMMGNPSTTTIRTSPGGGAPPSGSGPR